MTKDLRIRFGEIEFHLHTENSCVPIRSKLYSNVLFMAPSKTIEIPYDAVAEINFDIGLSLPFGKSARFSLIEETRCDWFIANVFPQGYSGPVKLLFRNNWHARKASVTIPKGDYIFRLFIERVYDTNNTDRGQIILKPGEVLNTSTWIYQDLDEFLKNLNDCPD